MNSYPDVVEMLDNWTRVGMTKEEIVVRCAEACMGWPYVWGAYGQTCTQANRERFMKSSSIGQGDIDFIRKNCQILNGSKGGCGGCKYYPGNERTLIFDCRGFTRWVLSKVGITLSGAGATSQYNTNSNWIQKGTIDQMPVDAVCCVFKHIKSTGKMDHTGLYVGGGRIIHCSGTVKEGKITDKGWTHFAIPKGLGGDAPVPEPTRKTLRKGARGDDVVYLQTRLIQLDYDLSPYGADGSFGNKTLAAVKDFQRDHGLSVDGVVGPATWAALDSGEIEYYTVEIKHVSKDVANKIVGTYGGTMVKEEGGD